MEGRGESSEPYSIDPINTLLKKILIIREREMKTWQKLISGLGGVATGLCVTTTAVMADGNKWDTAGFVENATYNRESRGLSKFRNTAQFEFSKDFGSKFGASGFQINGTLRATYDGVYDLNDDEWGDNAGGSINLGSPDLPLLAGPGAPTSVPFGAGLSYTVAPLPPTFGFQTGGPTGEADWTQVLGTNLGLQNIRSLNNPNSGLESLGARRGAIDGGVQLGVPVRPCDEDSRGCKALEGYMDADGDELAWSDFNDRLDFIRELYIQGNFDLKNGDQLGVKVGKQQIVWGRTDLFRVLDVLNPVDFSRNNIYDELEDIRIPMWMAELEYRWGSIGAFDDLNLSMVWNFDKFRPNKLGQAGTPNAILDAGSFFRAMANCWENGCTVGNFAADLLPFAAGGMADGVPEIVAMDFGPGVIGIRDVDMPSWSLSNSQIGIKLEGVIGDFGFSLNALETRQQLPSLRGIVTSADPFAPGTTGDFDSLIAFDIAFPRVTLIGGSLDYYMESLKATWRVEAALTDGEEFADSSVADLFSESNVARWVVGFDRPTFIPFLNKNRAFLVSAQAFGQHLLDHREETSLTGTTIGMPDHEDNYLFTLLLQGWYKNDRLNPQVIIAHDLEAGHTTVAPAIEWLFDNHWQFTLRANYKLGDGVDKYDDARGALPFPGMVNLGLIPPALLGQNVGSPGGANPLGRFRDGPLGMAHEEDEIQLTIRYRF